MASRRRVRPKNYSPDTILFRNIFGILVMAIGVLAAVSALGILQGSVFTAIRRIVQGLGGSLCLGVPLFIVWGGLLVMLSAYRRTSLRAFTLLFLFFLFVLGIISLLSKISGVPLLEYFGKNSKDDYLSMLFASYNFDKYQGALGGVLGMLTAWPLSTFVGTIGGVIVLSLLGLLCLLFFSRFDFIGSLRQLLSGRKTTQDQRKLEKSRQAHLKKLEKQKAEEEREKRSLQLPAFMRRNHEHDATVQQPETQPRPMPPARQQTRQTTVPRPPVNPHVQLYDETIVSEPLSGSLKATGDTGKALKRMDEIRQRKAQLARQMGEAQEKTIESWPPVAAPPVRETESV
ncbi:MAG: hypothetical protein IH607_05555, partial [Firmicutes bacterium]|nr:hypothetical protein [Bacillota bacterium]